MPSEGTLMKNLAQKMLALFLCALASTAVLTIEVEALPPEILHYGPFASTLTDSGTCGSDWATDTSKRSFVIDTSKPKVVIANFEEGTFVTKAGPSPNACIHMPAPVGNGNTVGAGITGRYSGSFDALVSGGTFNSAAKCTRSTCDTLAKFIRTVYGPAATFAKDNTFFDFNYYTRVNGAWHNASANRGGNQGDITS
jgi:hypothetical protein